MGRYSVGRGHMWWVWNRCGAAPARRHCQERGRRHGTCREYMYYLVHVLFSTCTLCVFAVGGSRHTLTVDTTLQYQPITHQRWAVGYHRSKIAIRVTYLKRRVPQVWAKDPPGPTMAAALATADVSFVKALPARCVATGSMCGVYGLWVCRTC